MTEKIRCCGPIGCGSFEPVEANMGTYGTLELPAAVRDAIKILMLPRWCIGADCAGWRKNKDPDRVEAGISEYGGHCGLAGAP